MHPLRVWRETLARNFQENSGRMIRKATVRVEPCVHLRRWVWAALMACGCIAAQATGATARGASSAPPPWWQNAVIYEIYPRSFQDSNGDGVGDLNGITQRLDYLQALGVDAIWIAPMFPSPQVDFGYDISDYEAVDPQYGTLADFDRLVAEAGKRGIKVIIDMVLNHTTNQRC
jgi:alpha-glucosidase